MISVGEPHCSQIHGSAGRSIARVLRQPIGSPVGRLHHCAGLSHGEDGLGGRRRYGVEPDRSRGILGHPAQTAVSGLVHDAGRRACPSNVAVGGRSEADSRHGLIEGHDGGPSCTIVGGSKNARMSIADSVVDTRTGNPRRRRALERNRDDVVGVARRWHRASEPAGTTVGCVSNHARRADRNGMRRVSGSPRYCIELRCGARRLGRPRGAPVDRTPNHTRRTGRETVVRIAERHAEQVS